jgi:hypothetical protein
MAGGALAMIVSYSIGHLMAQPVSSLSKICAAGLKGEIEDCFL